MSRGSFIDEQRREEGKDIERVIFTTYSATTRAFASYSAAESNNFSVNMFINGTRKQASRFSLYLLTAGVTFLTEQYDFTQRKQLILYCLDYIIFVLYDVKTTLLIF